MGQPRCLGQTCFQKSVFSEVYNVTNLKECAFRNYGTPFRRTNCRKSQKLHFQNFWDSGSGPGPKPGLGPGRARAQARPRPKPGLGPSHGLAQAGPTPKRGPSQGPSQPKPKPGPGPSRAWAQAGRARAQAPDSVVRCGSVFGSVWFAAVPYLARCGSPRFRIWFGLVCRGTMLTPHYSQPIST